VEVGSLSANSTTREKIGEKDEQSEERRAQLSVRWSRYGEKKKRGMAEAPKSFVSSSRRKKGGGGG